MSTIPIKVSVTEEQRAPSKGHPGIFFIDLKIKTSHICFQGVVDFTASRFD